MGGFGTFASLWLFRRHRVNLSLGDGEYLAREAVEPLELGAVILGLWRDHGGVGHGRDCSTLAKIYA